ncbi:MAG: hypothetical protein R3B93_26175 [Bacteroidia bacterium]
MPNISLNSKALKFYSEEMFEFEKASESLPERKAERNFHIELQYKKGNQRYLQISFFQDSSVLVKESKIWWKITPGNIEYFYILLFDCKVQYLKTFDLLLSDKQIFAFQAEEDSLLNQVLPGLTNLRLPQIQEDHSEVSITTWGSHLIYSHLILYEQYYNFPQIKRAILNSFQQLALDLKENHIPVLLKHSGIYYQPLFHIMKSDEGWVCYIGSDIFVSHIADAYEQFNNIMK